MLVYRLMNKKELNLHLAGKINEVGGVFQKKDKLSNNHRYKTNGKYIHMFKNLDDLEYVQYEREDFEYLAIFDIPMIVLMASKGKGLYNKLDNGELKYKHIREYAINTKYMKTEYFLGYEEIIKFKYNIDDLAMFFKNSRKLNSERGYKH